MNSTPSSSSSSQSSSQSSSSSTSSFFKLLTVVVIPHKLDFFCGLRFFRMHYRVFDDKGHDIPAQVFYALLAGGGNQIELIFPAQRLRDGFRFLFRLSFIHQVNLVKDQPARLRSQFLTVFFQLADDDPRILNRIGTVNRLNIDEMQQYAATLQVLPGSECRGLRLQLRLQSAQGCRPPRSSSRCPYAPRRGSVPA